MPFPMWGFRSLECQAIELERMLPPLSGRAEAEILDQWNRGAGSIPMVTWPLLMLGTIIDNFCLVCRATQSLDK